MRISDWSSDVCSSDLDGGRVHRPDSIGGAGGVCRAGSIYGAGGVPGAGTDLLGAHQHPGDAVLDALELPDPPAELLPRAGVVARSRQSVVQGTSVSVRVDLGGRVLTEKKTRIT